MCLKQNEQKSFQGVKTHKLLLLTLFKTWQKPSNIVQFLLPILQVSNLVALYFNVYTKQLKVSTSELPVNILQT